MVLGSVIQLTNTNADSAVLNLSKEASQTEINERHRSLSLIFHPDKQRVDDYKKEVASAEFLKVQKAYEGQRV
jgi:DnaJ family protein C protein 11